MKKKLNLIILITGLSGLIAQVLLLREFLIIFLGNELSIGIILSNWLIVEALGSFLGGKFFSKKKEFEGFIVFLWIFSLFFPLAIFLIRVLKPMLGYLPSEALGLRGVFLSSFLLLFPTSFSHGALFSLGCRLHSKFSQRKDSSSIGKVYALETLGTLLGGLVFTYLLIPFFNSFKISFFLSLINIFLSLFLLNSKERFFLSKFLGGGSFFLLLLFSFLIIKEDKINKFSLRRQWPKQEILYYKNSIYGNLCLTRYKSQFNLFSNGVVLFSLPTPDIVKIEELSHFPLLFHPKPCDVLIISGGLGGFIKEVLKHPQVKNIDYAELDPLVFEVAQKFLLSLVGREISNKRVSIKNLDGRFYLKIAKKKYDLIWIGLDSPSDLQSNRLFTKEFFKEALLKLKEEGILIINLPGSLTYLNKELRALNSCILNTLREVFPYVRIIPSDGYNIFLASLEPYILRVSPLILSQRLRERNIKTSLLTKGHIEYRLSSYWQEWIRSSLKHDFKGVNQDLKPLGLFYALSYFSSSFSPGVNEFLLKFKNISVVRIFFWLLLFYLSYLVVSSRFKGCLRFNLFYLIFSSGFAGMIFSLILIFSFQVLYGYIYYWIGILVSVFMAGSAMGALFFSKYLERGRRGVLCLYLFESLIIGFSFLLIFLLSYFYPYLEKAGSFLLIKGIYLVSCFFSGFFLGVEFPLANELFIERFKVTNLGYSAGFLYSADLLGGFLGGILGGVILFPILGAEKTLLIIAILKLSSLGLVGFLNPEPSKT